MLLDLHCDPTSPASWRTTRWLDAVAHERGGELRLRPHSPLLAGGDDDQEPIHGALRVGERAREEHGDAAATRFYRELMRRLHDEGHHLFEGDLDALLIDVDLEPSLVAAALDPSWDDDIEVAMEEAIDAAGPMGSPVALVARDAGPATLVGAVPDPVPTGAAAVALFDRLVRSAGTDGCVEVGPMAGDQMSSGSG
jgi:hypothetical protein